MIRYYWMTPADTPEEFTDSVRAPLNVTSNAEECTVAISTIEVEDEDSAYDFKAWRRVYIVEDDAPTDETVVYMGHISDVVIERMHPYSATARKWTLSVSDLNYYLNIRIFRGDADRPEETDLERLTWLLG